MIYEHIMYTLILSVCLWWRPEGFYSFVIESSFLLEPRMILWEWCHFLFKLRRTEDSGEDLGLLKFITTSDTFLTTINFLISWVVVLFVISVINSIALWQYLLLQGVKVNSRLACVVSVQFAQTAQDILEGPPHISVPEAVDDGIDKGVAFSQYQEVLLVAQHLALITTQTVEQQHHKARRPAEHKTACWGSGRRRVHEFITKVVITLEINKKSPR